MTNLEEGSSRPGWKTYPFVIAPGDPRLTCPAAEGDPGVESSTWYVAGRLRGRGSGREWAFLTVFVKNDVWHRVRADFHTFALFDLATGDYATFTEYDLPRPPRRRKAYRLVAARGKLDLAFRSSAGRSTWKSVGHADGTLEPFASVLDLHGRDTHGLPMRLELRADARKPPFPVGGEETGGRKTCIGQPDTVSWFQSDLRFAGVLQWGETREEVDGDCGWIDRQWAPRYLGVHNDRRSSRYRHEWRQIHLDDGFELSAWLQVDRRRGNRTIPFSGVTAAPAEGGVLATTDFEVEPLSFVRDPGHVDPLFRLSRRPAWLVDRYRLRVPAWELDVVSEPLVPAPAHAFPIEYWSGPTRITGTRAGRAVAGFGFHERTRILFRDFELVEALRATLRHLPADAFPAGSPGAPTLGNRVWEVDAFLSRGAREEALAYLRAHVRPEIERLVPPHRDPPLALLDDLADSIFRWWVRG